MSSNLDLFIRDRTLSLQQGEGGGRRRVFVGRHEIF